MASNSSLGLKASGVLALVGVGMFVAANLAAPPQGRNGVMVHDWSRAPAWAGPLLVLAILTIVVAGIWFFVSLSRSRQTPSRGTADISAEVAACALPFSVCSHCRIVIELPHAFACPRCDRSTTTVRVETDDERSIALAALGPPG